MLWVIQSFCCLQTILFSSWAGCVQEFLTLYFSTTSCFSLACCLLLLRLSLPTSFLYISSRMVCVGGGTLVTLPALSIETQPSSEVDMLSKEPIKWLFVDLRRCMRTACTVCYLYLRSMTSLIFVQWTVRSAVLSVIRMWHNQAVCSQLVMELQTNMCKSSRSVAMVKVPPPPHLFKLCPSDAGTPRCGCDAPRAHGTSIGGDKVNHMLTEFPTHYRRGWSVCVAPSPVFIKQELKV